MRFLGLEPPVRPRTPLGAGAEVTGEVGPAVEEGDSITSEDTVRAFS